MKTTTKNFSILISVILFSCITLLQTHSHANNIQSSTQGNDSTKIAGASNVTHSAVKILTPEEISASVFDDPNYWVNYLETTLGPELQQYEISNDVIDEMENNPTFWVDYLQNTVKEELVLQP